MTDPAEPEHRANQSQPALPELLVKHDGALRRFIERRGTGLLRYESVSDLVQGVHADALASENRFEFRSEEAFRGWLNKVAMAHIGHRNDYWKAKKRAANHLIRVTTSDATRNDAAVNPAASITGPSSFALRRERYAIAARAVACLPPRDQDLVRFMLDGLTIDAMAKQLGISHSAAERARLRTVERFEKTYRFLLGGAE